LSSNFEQFSTYQLEKCKEALEKVKKNRSGGLLVPEQKALDDILAELERRADIDYCKAHDC